MVTSMFPIFAWPSHPLPRTSQSTCGRRLSPLCCVVVARSSRGPTDPRKPSPCQNQSRASTVPNLPLRRLILALPGDITVLPVPWCPMPPAQGHNSRKPGAPCHAPVALSPVPAHGAWCPAATRCSEPGAKCPVPHPRLLPFRLRPVFGLKNKKVVPGCPDAAGARHPEPPGVPGVLCPVALGPVLAHVPAAWRLAVDARCTHARWKQVPCALWFGCGPRAV